MRLSRIARRLPRRRLRPSQNTCKANRAGRNWFGCPRSFPASRTEMREHNGFQTIEHQEFGGEIGHAIRALNDANIAVYPIDPRDPYNVGLTGEGIDTMNLFAGGTGGKAFYGLTDLAEAIRAAVHDSAVTYALGFYPERVKLDGRYHSLSVKVAREGVEVRARKGYFATESKPLTEKERRDSIHEILDSPLDATGIGLSAKVEPLAGKPDTYDLVLYVRSERDSSGAGWGSLGSFD